MSIHSTNARIFVFVFLLGVMGAGTPAQAAPGVEIQVSPATGTFTFGDEFDVNFLLTTGGQAVGGVQVDVSYSPHFLFIGSSDAGSVFSQTVLAPVPSGNTFPFTRVRFDEGYTGTDGHVLRVRFRAVSAGEGAITINPASTVIAFSDSSNILQTITNGSYTVHQGQGAVCGDGACNLGENCGTCLQDCPCAQDQICSHNACTVPLFCGDGTCTARSESCGTCLADCPCPSGTVCQEIEREYQCLVGGGEDSRGEDTYSPDPASPSERMPPLSEVPLMTPQRCTLFVLPEGEPLPNTSGKLRLMVEGKEITYSDVRTHEWFARYVASAINAGLAQGYRNAAGELTGEFGVSKSVLIGEIAKFAAHFAGIPVTGETPQNPSAKGQWSAAYVAAMEAQGIRLFRAMPNVLRAATRAEVVHILLATLGVSTEKNLPNPFNDLTLDAPYANDILTATHMGVIRGDTDPDGTFLYRVRGNDPVNRVETITLFARLAERGCQ